MFIDGSLTAQRYVNNILEPVSLLFLDQHDDVTTLQQDSRRSHSADITMDNSSEHVMPWPAFSPSLSPIEHLYVTS